MNKLSEYKRKKEFLVCVDSDGCAMDTMDIKHICCFGPCMVEEWGLERWGGEILARWNEMNLYTMTRGINRYKGLSMALQEIDHKYKSIEDLGALVHWAETSRELSDGALEQAIRKQDSISLRKALSWSRAVNASINRLPEERKQPFEGVKEALASAHKYADVAIVSSANLDAVLEEWERFDLRKDTDIVLAQDAGSKEFCIRELLQVGYDREHVLMCGDAPGDLDAADKNQVFFYPILVRYEKESWREFREKAMKKLLKGSYGGDYQKEKKEAFLENLQK